MLSLQNSDRKCLCRELWAVWGRRQGDAVQEGGIMGMLHGGVRTMYRGDKDSVLGDKDNV